MKSLLFIAFRYIFSRKQQTAVNLISVISLTGISLGTAALIVVLSVFNGFSGLINGLYDRVDPDVKVLPAEGKHIDSDSLYLEISNLPGVQNVSMVYAEKALFRRNNQEYVAEILGVDSNYISIHPIDSFITSGRMMAKDARDMVIGQGMAYYLSLGLGSGRAPYIEISIPINKEGLAIRADRAFSQHRIPVVGVFQMQGEFDARYAIMSKNRLQEWTNQYNRFSWYEVEAKSGYDIYALEDEIKALTGKDYLVQNRIDQHAFLQKVMATEKWAIYLIFTFILLIATFNLIGSLAMVILDKSKEIKTLWSLGADWPKIRMIFWLQGLILSLIGALVGTGIGSFISWGQETYGWVKMGASGAFLVEAYPINLDLSTMLIAFGTVLIIGSLAALIPALRIGVDSEKA